LAILLTFVLDSRLYLLVSPVVLNSSERPRIGTGRADLRGRGARGGSVHAAGNAIDLERNSIVAGCRDRACGLGAARRAANAKKKRRADRGSVGCYSIT
jgi:hypothetical protein